LVSHRRSPRSDGTGAFEGVSGHIDNLRVAPGVIDRTFHLLARHHCGSSPQSSWSAEPAAEPLTSSGAVLVPILDRDLAESGSRLPRGSADALA
jgi:hypothetical protein